MPSSLRSRTPRKALSKSGSGSSFDLGDPGSSELDSLSTNGSISGESEDQQQQQQPQQKPAPSPIPGMDPSWEKQEKTRLKNERKHQRHKDRKLKELRDRCAGVLMHRKLETLVYQLTSMGFTSDRAAAALALNEGDVEKSITFLLDYDGSGAARSLPRPPGNLPLKLDISEELGKLGELESRGYSLPDVERAVVACEGDFEAATRLLQDQVSHPKPVTPGLNPVAPPPPPGWPRVPGVHEAQGGPVYHPVAPAGARLDPRLVERVHHHHQHPHRDLVADWRSSHPHPVNRAGAHRINGFPGSNHHHHHHHHHHPHHQQQQQQEFFQAPVAHHHQSMFNPAMINPMNSQAPPAPAGGGNWGSFESGSWNVTSAPRVDYQAIDWSVGLPGKPMGLGGSLMRSSSDQIHHQGQSGVGVGVSQQEWTSPFAGKDLFHHHPVHSL